MLLKVCGMRQPDNIRAIDALKPDWLGFIFYPPSRRFVGEEASFSPDLLANLQARRIGVFVNEEIPHLLAQQRAYALDGLQLHGDETPEYVAEVRKNLPDALLIKAFGIGDGFDFEKLANFVPHCNYFIFDTKGKDYGGNGTKYDWAILARYALPTPFLLSGGIRPDDAEAILACQHPQLAGIDLNSGFEIAPALKDATALATFFSKIQQSQ